MGRFGVEQCGVLGSRWVPQGLEWKEGGSRLYVMGNRQAIQALLEGKADVNRGNADSTTALMSAAHSSAESATECMRVRREACLRCACELTLWYSKMLLDAGANVNARHKDGTIALHWATSYRSLERLKVGC